MDNTSHSDRALLVARGDIADVHLGQLPDQPSLGLADGAVALRVDRFALTSNNVTYAVLGQMLRYWEFFPAGDSDVGIVPAWGVATVTESRHESLAVGEVLYGYVPMADRMVLQPASVNAREVVDGSPHRAGLPGTYQRYARLAVDPLHDDSTTDLELLYRPLFSTAFLLAEVVAGAARQGARLAAVIITSASSKTSSALAHLLAERDIEVIGITSSSNAATVVAAGRYDRVLSYDDLDALADVPGAVGVVDVAGRPDVVASAHLALPDGLAEHHVVGVTHHEMVGRTPSEAPPGAPTPTMFFAPDHASRLAEAWGGPALGAKIAAAWGPFVTALPGEVRVTELAGLAGAANAWRELVAGVVDPTEGLVVVLHE